MQFIGNANIKKLGLICLLTGTSACNLISQDKQKLAVNQDSSPAACLIALAEHDGSTPYDLKIQRLQQQLSQKPDHFASLEKLGWAYVDKAASSFDPGYYKLAEQTVVCLQSKHTDEFAGLLLQGHIHQHMHQFKQAETIARQLVQQRGRWFDHGLLGDALMEQGQLLEARHYYQAMMDQNPGSQAYNRAANMRWLTGDIEGATELLELSLSAQAGRINNNSAWTLVQLAKLDAHHQQFDRARQRLHTLLKQQPDYAPALLLLGKIHLQQGEHAQALQRLERAHQLNPLPEYRWALLEALNDESQQHMIRQHLLNTGAIEDRRTLSLYLASRHEQPQTALHLAEQELQARQDVFSLDAYAWALHSNQRSAEALSFSRQALSYGTPSARLLYHAAVIARSNDLDKEAEKLHQQAKQLEHMLLPSERLHLNQFL